MRTLPRVPSLLGVLLLLLVLPASTQDGANLLLVIADDVGMYELASFGEGSDPAVTPAIDGLARDGVSFQNCYANPLCTPTRATIHTGRYAIQTGCGDLMTLGWGLPTEEVTIAELLADAPEGYSRGFFGKWHLTNDLFKPAGFAATFYTAAVRDERYTLIGRYPPIIFELYDLYLDPLDGSNLMGTRLTPAAQAALQTLKADLVAKMSSYFL